MPSPTPFHERTVKRCDSYAFKEWAGYVAVRRFHHCAEAEYTAFRHACGLLDVSPLFKYEVRGKDAARFLAYVLTRDPSRMKPGSVAYVTWCDDRGKILDDGTVTRLEDDLFRVTSAEPSLAWFQRHARGFLVQITDQSAAIAALALQGPTSRAVLASVTDADVNALRFFRHTHARLDGIAIEITRTGYTGDLGYEIWVPREHALTVYDALIAAGGRHGLLPAGLDALDMTRVEAGFVLQGVDYLSARECQVDSQTSTPFELDLGFTVQLNRDRFIGQAALKEERARGVKYAFVGLEVDWIELEAHYLRHKLPPAVVVEAWRDAKPVYFGKRQIGRATSGTWSPGLKKNLALATVDAHYARVGTRLQIEATVEYERKRVTATVVEKPFFNPERKRT